jgi:hypothetical protein
MANPWEQDWSQPTAQAAPWEHEWSAPAPSKTFVEKLGETWPARVAKGIYSGVTLPGDVYQGNTAVDPSNPEFIGRTLDLATVASPVAPRAVSSVAAAGPPTTEALAQAANQGYKTVRESGVEYNPQAVADLAQTTAQGLEKQGFRAGRAPETHANLASMGAPPAGAVSTIDDLQYAKQVFGDILKEPQRYSAADRAAASIAKQHIEGYIQQTPAADVLAGDAALAGKSLRDADKNYAALKRSEQITGAQDVAEGNAAAANSGRNIDNAYRQRFNAILKSDKQSLGFSPEEIARMETLRDGSRMANALRYTGNMMSGVGGQTTGAIGAWMYNPVLAATPLVGHLLKKGADWSTLRHIKALDEATRMRSALGEEAAGSASMTPAEQLRQSALIKALMNGTIQSSQTAPNDMLESPAFSQGARR